MEGGLAKGFHSPVYGFPSVTHQSPTMSINCLVAPPPHIPPMIPSSTDAALGEIIRNALKPANYTLRSLLYKMWSASESLLEILDLRPTQVSQNLHFDKLLGVLGTRYSLRSAILGDL